MLRTGPRFTPGLNLDDATTTAVTAYKGKPIIIK